MFKYRSNKMDLFTGSHSTFSRTTLWFIFLLSIIKFVHPVFVMDRNMMSVLSNALSKQRYTPTISNTFQKEYDYIVVGAGSAGSVVANRLSEIPCVNVLLLEAGGHPPLLSEVPAIALILWFTDVDWQFQTVPQRNTGYGLENRQMPLPRGKMLGGSSSLNNLLYVRGNRKDYDNWAAMGAKGWSYKEVFPYFLKLEDNRDPEFLANGYHNITGPFTVHQPRYQPLLKRYLHGAITELGHKILDSNGKRQLGFFDLQGSTRNGQRCGTAKAYLVPAENRKNLDIVINAMVKKVLIHNRSAIGVEFDFGGQTYRIKARKEVIVSAGSIKTPQLLMLSGIGPRKELKKLKIPVVADLPVGRNFHDHAAFVMTYSLSPKVPSLVKKFLNPKTYMQYIKNRAGPLSSLTFLLYLAWFRGNTTSSPIDFPTYELYLGELVAAEPARRIYGVRQDVFSTLYGPYMLKPLLLCLVQQTQPRSRGTVTLNSTSIYDMPLIDPNYLDDIRDQEDMLEGMKSCDRIALSRSMSLVGTQPLATLLPGCESYANDRDNYYRCQLRSILVSGHHSAGSSKMGDANDPTTVVDPQLRVKTIKGLRVVDTSIMPTVASGNLNTPTIMIAEKASDMIKETISCHRPNAKAKEHGKAEYEPPTSVKQEDWIKQSFFDSGFDYTKFPVNTSFESPFFRKGKVLLENIPRNKVFLKPNNDGCLSENCQKSPWSDFDDFSKEPDIETR